jgi:hypothetical protein
MYIQSHRALQACNSNETEGSFPGTGDTVSGFSLPSSASGKCTPPQTSLKLDTSVANRQIQRQGYWERLGDKLSSAHRWMSPEVQTQFANFQKCRQESVYRICRSCGDWQALPYQCSLKWCPMCVFKLSRQRQEKLLHWTSRIKQPKHVVTTQLNLMMIDRASFVRNSENMRRLQRAVVFAGVRGGCVSTEVTNKSRGWHLHNHWLVDADWVDAVSLAKTWASIVDQRFAIVKVKDARAKDYRSEVAKYVCKSSELVSWTPRQIAMFVSSLYRTRLFVRFGSLRTEPAFVPTPEHRVCACGCSEFIHQTEAGAVVAQLRRNR